VNWQNRELFSSGREIVGGSNVAKPFLWLRIVRLDHALHHFDSFLRIRSLTMAIKNFRRWLTQLSPETTPVSNIKKQPMLGLQSLDVRCLPTVMHGVMLCDPPVVEQCHVSTVDPSQSSGKASGGKCDTTKASKGKASGSKSSGGKCDTTKASKGKASGSKSSGGKCDTTKASKGKASGSKASGGKCEVKGSSSKGSNGKSSGGKGSNGKCDLWVNFPGHHEPNDDGHKPCGYGYEPVCTPVPPPVTPPVTPPVCPPVVPPVVPPVCPPVVPPVVPPVCPPVVPPVSPPDCETKGSKGKAEAGKKSNGKAEAKKASSGKGEAKKASSSKGSNGKGRNSECNFSVPNPKAQATKILKDLYGIKC
jgi:hypothetical protein